MDRQGIVYAGLDFAILQCAAQRVAVRRADGVDGVDVAGVGHDFGQPHAAIVQKLTVPGGVRASRFGPRFQMAQFDAQNGALDSLHSIVIALEFVNVLLFRAPVPQHANLVRELGAAGGHRSAFSAGSKVLARVEAEAAHLADAARAAALILRAVRLCRVLDHHQPVPARDIHDGVHVGRLSEEVNRHDRPGARRNGCLDPRDIDIERRRIDIHEDRPGAGIDDGGRGGYEGEWRRDYFVPGADTGGEQCQMQRAGARIHADRFGGAAIPGELLFECRNLRPEDELGVLQNANDRSVQLALDGLILGLEV